MSWVAATFLASQAVSSMAQLSSGSASQKAAEYNANLAERDAKMAREAADFDISRIRTNNRLRLGTGRANIGAGNIVMSGSALEALAFSATQGEMDVLARRYRGEVEANSALSRAAMARYEGKVAQRTAAITAIGSAASGIATGAQMGMFDSLGQTTNKALRPDPYKTQAVRPNLVPFSQPVYQPQFDLFSLRNG